MRSFSHAKFILKKRAWGVRDCENRQACARTRTEEVLVLALAHTAGRGPRTCVFLFIVTLWVSRHVGIFFSHGNVHTFLRNVYGYERVRTVVRVHTFVVITRIFFCLAVCRLVVCFSTARPLVRKQSCTGGAWGIHTRMPLRRNIEVST